MKQCSVCTENKPLDAFTRDRRRSDGRSSRCKACHSAKTTAWRQANPDYLRGWYLAHRPDPVRTPVLVVDDMKACSACSVVQLLEDFHLQKAGVGGRRATCKRCLQRAYRANPEPSRERSRRAREANPDYMRLWRAANRERLAEYDRQYRLHLADCDFSREYMADLYAELRAQPCAYCDGPSGEVDHVIPLSRGGRHHPDNLVAACRGCNGSKGNRLVGEWDGPPKLR